MKKMMMVFTVLMCLSVGAQAFAIDTNVLGVVTGGTIRASSTYFAFGGKATVDSPAFENRYASEYSSRGTAGLAVQNAFSGAMEVKEQFEVQSGFGRFSSRASTGTVINIPREDAGDGPQIIDGTFKQNAAGFGGALSPGIVTSSFATVDGLIAKSEAEGFGKFGAAGIQRVETGTNIPGTGPTTTEYQQASWRFDGKFQVKVEIIFPK